jgi:hypothetical protein
MNSLMERFLTWNLDLEPTGEHEEVAAFVSRKVNVQIDNLDQPYFIPQRCLIKPQEPRSPFALIS